jgi:hypothetical protein
MVLLRGTIMWIRRRSFILSKSPIQGFSGGKAGASASDRAGKVLWALAGETAARASDRSRSKRRVRWNKATSLIVRPNGPAPS